MGVTKLGFSVVRQLVSQEKIVQGEEFQLKYHQIPRYQYYSTFSERIEKSWLFQEDSDLKHISKSPMKHLEKRR